MTEISGSDEVEQLFKALSVLYVIESCTDMLHRFARQSYVVINSAAARKLAASAGEVPHSHRAQTSSDSFGCCISYNERVSMAHSVSIASHTLHQPISHQITFSYPRSRKTLWSFLCGSEAPDTGAPSRAPTAARPAPSCGRALREVPRKGDPPAPRCGAGRGGVGRARRRALSIDAAQSAPGLVPRCRFVNFRVSFRRRRPHVLPLPPPRPSAFPRQRTALQRNDVKPSLLPQKKPAKYE
ncbi:hypothetical protein EVAR_55257_1 [Eumeta japonica]|uniref:Uncharacterized protein n=1 Tax=Eumeta variegata TaxID=151549 RepID=A0A4C1Z5M7_EUMVA|nr:hypothetical protein EVAR_55257_1 [Eumeta japonica]